MQYVRSGHLHYKAAVHSYDQFSQPVIQSILTLIMACPPSKPSIRWCNFSGKLTPAAVNYIFLQSECACQRLFF